MASTNFDMTAANAALKELDDGQVVENLVYSDNPFLALVKKNENAGGKFIPVPIVTGTSQGVSSTFSNAQGNQAAAEIQSFLITRAKNYSVATLDNETMLAAASDKMAFIDAAQFVIDNAIRGCTNQIAAALFSSGTGSMGKIAAGGITSGVITLASASDVVFFERNQTLQATATDGGTPRAALGYVIAVNRTAGTVTVSATGLGGNAGSPSAWAPGDFLLVQGTNNAWIKGLGAWLPAVAPTTGDSFFGVDRSVDPVRLAGVRYDGSAQSIEEALIDASQLISREGGAPDYAFMNYASYGALLKGLGAKVQYVDLSGPAGIGFKAVQIHGARKPINVLVDRSCPAAKAYLLQMNTWKLMSLKGAPHIDRGADGFEMLRVYNQDAAEARIASYANLACNAPGWNGVVSLGA